MPPTPSEAARPLGRRRRLALLAVDVYVSAGGSGGLGFRVWELDLGFRVLGVGNWVGLRVYVSAGELPEEGLGVSGFGNWV